MLEIGIKGTKTIIFNENNTALAMGSGELAVFATPAMIAMMEATASESIKPFLDEGTTSVGRLINVQHLSATPVGMNVRCESELMELDRKRCVFKVHAFDDCGLIGEGTHERFIVTIEKFMAKTNEKKTSK